MLSKTKCLSKHFVFLYPDHYAVSHCDTMYIMSHVHSCWLSAEEGTIFAFVVPMLVIILVNLRLCVMLEFMVDLAWGVGIIAFIWTTVILMWKGRKHSGVHCSPEHAHCMGMNTQRIPLACNLDTYVLRSYLWSFSCCTSFADVQWQCFMTAENIVVVAAASVL